MMANRKKIPRAMICTRNPTMSCRTEGDLVSRDSQTSGEKATTTYDGLGGGINGSVITRVERSSCSLDDEGL